MFQTVVRQAGLDRWRRLYRTVNAPKNVERDEERYCVLVVLPLL